jgi:hypothetical protein
MSPKKGIGITAVAILLISAVLMPFSIAALQIVHQRPLEIVDEYEIKIVKPPLEIVRTVLGVPTLCPGETTNVAYLIKDNTGPNVTDAYTTTPFIIEVHYKIEYPEYLIVRANLANVSGGNIILNVPEGKFSVQPGQQVYFIVAYTLRQDAPIGEIIKFRIILEEGEWHEAG